MSNVASTLPASSAQMQVRTGLQGFVFALFFIFGGLTSLNDVLIPKLKDLFSLSYAEVMLVQSAFFIGYLIVSIPAGFLVTRLGYMRSAVAGLLTMALGCILFLPAANSALFIAFLGALFVVAAGITIVQVVANPLISILGPAATASSRLTFAQAFNSLGTTVFPYIGATLILGSIATANEHDLSPMALATFRAKEAAVISRTYLELALALVLIASVVWLMRNRLRENKKEATNLFKALDLLKRRRFAFGMLCIFAYVGAEVAIGSILANYLMQANTLALDAQSAGKHLAYYWGGAMVGRFVGAAVLRICRPGKVLTGAAVLVLVLLAISSGTVGLTSGWALLGVGLFNSIMFPTIFSLASEGLGVRTAEGSGLICVAIVGGALIPPFTGYIADQVGLGIALVVPAVCYAIIAGFGWYARYPVSPDLQTSILPRGLKWNVRCKRGHILL